MVKKQTRQRRIAAAVRIGLVAVLFLLNIALVILLSYYLQKHAFLIYLILEAVGIIVAVRLQGRWGSPSYKLAWTILVLAFPVAGLVLYELWGGSAQRRKQMLQPVKPPPHKV